MPDDRPQFIFFRNVPAILAASEFLANSLQSLETSFILTGARRYVHAFVNCVSAIEGALRAAPIGSKDRDDFRTLLKKAKNARDSSNLLRSFQETKIEELRENRNRIVHRGFSSKDNSVCVDLLISVALPLLGTCYEDFHAVRLYDDLRKDHNFIAHLNITAKVCKRARSLGIDMTYSIGSFAHLVRLFIKPNFTSDWEGDSLTHIEETGQNWEFKETEKRKLERLFSMPWTFDCPVCEDFESLICDLEVDDRRLTPARMACTNCGYVVGDAQPFIGELLLKDQLTDDIALKILKEYGLSGR